MQVSNIVLFESDIIVNILRNECSYGEGICKALSSHTKEEEEVEKLMQKYYVVYRSIAQSLIPAIIVIIIGIGILVREGLHFRLFQAHFLIDMVDLCHFFYLFL